MPLQLKMVGAIPFAALGETRFFFKELWPNGGNSGQNFGLKFRLPEGSEIRFFFFANRDLTGGVEVSFSRSSGNVSVTFSLNGSTHTEDLGQRSDTLDLSLDVHNDHTDAHILLWGGGRPLRRGRRVY